MGLYLTAGQSDFHLVLAQQCSADPDYKKAFTRGYGPVGPDDFVILDNGAYEGDMVTNDYLFNTALDIKANEIVLPDKMRSVEGTIESSVKAIKAYDVWYNFMKPSYTFGMMGVLQTSGSMGEVIESLEQFAKWPQITTVGIPRHFCDIDKYFRYQVLNVNQEYKDRFKFHLLGTNPKVPNEVSLIADRFPWVRSVDSSLPYNYTLAGVVLTTYAARIERPVEYFERDWSGGFDRYLLQDNINTYMRWARGTEGARS